MLAAKEDFDETDEQSKHGIQKAGKLGWEPRLHVKRGCTQTVKAGHSPGIDILQTEKQQTRKGPRNDIGLQKTSSRTTAQAIKLSP